jgi:hypothetical protein
MRVDNWRKFGMNFVKSFEDPEAYKLSEDLSNLIFELTLEFPREEKYYLIDQIRRSSSSRNVCFISNECAANLLNHNDRVGSMLNAMITKAHLFCRPKRS